MALSFLCAPKEKITAIPMTFDWDDWDPYEVVGEPNDKLIDKLSKLSFRANLTFSLGCTEWVVFRFSNVSEDPVPYQYLEAFWAFNMSDQFKAPKESEDEDWKGSVRGPINMALMTALNVIYGFEDGTPEPEAAYSDKIACHVLNSDPLYLKWRDRLLTRLESYKRDNKNAFGDPIPREILNTSVIIEPDQSNKLVKKFLSNIQIQTNPFLTVFKK